MNRTESVQLWTAVRLATTCTAAAGLRPQFISAVPATAVTSTMGAAMLLVASLVVEGPAGLQAAVLGNATAWGALAFLAFGATALAYAWYFDGVKALGAGAASGYITLVPVIGVALSALWLGESIDASIVLGLSLIHI